jgi:hypothetical protein
MVFSATFNNISVISWWSVLLPLLCMFCFLLFCYSIITTFLNKVDHRVSVNGEITHVIFHKWRNNTCAPPYLSGSLCSRFTVFTVFRLLTDFVCLYNYEFWLSLCKIVRSSVILLLPLFGEITHVSILVLRK